MQLAKHQEKFEAIGVRVAAISYDPTETNAEFVTDEGLGFPLLSDADHEVVNAFGIRNEQYPEGHFAYGIPHPGVMLIDQSGAIRLKQAVPDYRTRPKFDELVEAVSNALQE